MSKALIVTILSVGAGEIDGQTFNYCETLTAGNIPKVSIDGNDLDFLTGVNSRHWWHALVDGGSNRITPATLDALVTSNVITKWGKTAVNHVLINGETWEKTEFVLELANFNSTIVDVGATGVIRARDKAFPMLYWSVNEVELHDEKVSNAALIASGGATLMRAFAQMAEKEAV